MKKNPFFVGLMAATAITVGVWVVRAPVGDEVFFNEVGNTPTSQIAQPRSRPQATPDTSAPQLVQESSTPAKVGGSDPVLFSDIPEGVFKTGLKKLKKDVQEQVLDRLSKERQLLVDINSIRVDSNGMIYIILQH